MKVGASPHRSHQFPDAINRGARTFEGELTLKGPGGEVGFEPERKSRCSMLRANASMAP